MIKEEQIKIKDKIKVLTYQSKEVVDIILRDNIYKVNLEMCREKRDYSEDIKQLGEPPIWGYIPKNITKLENGDTLFTIKNEMSVDQEIINELFLIELELYPSQFKIGLSHNACDRVVVFKEIDINSVAGIYKVNYNEEEEYGWYFPTITVLYNPKDTALFKNNFKCINKR